MKTPRINKQIQGQKGKNNMNGRKKPATYANSFSY